MKTLAKLLIVIGLVTSLVGCSGRNVRIEYGPVEVKSINGLEVGK